MLVLARRIFKMYLVGFSSGQELIFQEGLLDSPACSSIVHSPSIICPSVHHLTSLADIRTTQRYVVPFGMKRKRGATSKNKLEDIPYTQFTESVTIGTFSLNVIHVSDEYTMMMCKSFEQHHF